MVQSSDRPTAPLTASNLELLRQFEPVVCYTKGEQFFPTDVDHYFRECSLWEHHPDGRDELLVRQGALTLEKLIEPRPAEFGSVRYLRFVEPLSLTEAARVLADQVALRKDLGQYFHPGLVDWHAAVSFPVCWTDFFPCRSLLRGKVSAATAAAAELDYNDIFSEDEKYTYYGRVTRQKWLDNSSVLVFLLLQQLALRFSWCQRSRIRLGNGHHIFIRAGRAANP